MKPSIQNQFTKNNLIVYVDGPLDYTTTGTYTRAINSLYDKCTGILSLKISLKDCPYIDTAGIGFLVKLRKKAKVLKQKLILTDVDPEIMEIFKIVNVTHWFEFR